MGFQPNPNPEQHHDLQSIWILVRKWSSCGATRPLLSCSGSGSFAVEFSACGASKVSGFSGAVRSSQTLTLRLQVVGA